MKKKHKKATKWPLQRKANGEKRKQRITKYVFAEPYYFDRDPDQERNLDLKRNKDHTA